MQYRTTISSQDGKHIDNITERKTDAIQKVSQMLEEIMVERTEKIESGKSFDEYMTVTVTIHISNKV